jgi:hypothetical protein
LDKRERESGRERRGEGERGRGREGERGRRGDMYVRSWMKTIEW